LDVFSIQAEWEFLVIRSFNHYKLSKSIPVILRFIAYSESCNLNSLNPHIDTPEL